MVKLEFHNCPKCGFIFFNRTQQIIVDLLKGGEELSISEIYRRVDIAYKNVYRTLEGLQNMGIIERFKKKKRSGKKIIIKLSIKSEILRKQSMYEIVR